MAAINTSDCGAVISLTSVVTTITQIRPKDDHANRRLFFHHLAISGGVCCVVMWGKVGNKKARVSGPGFYQMSG